MGVREDLGREHFDLVRLVVKLLAKALCCLLLKQERSYRKMSKRTQCK